jgi:hypothetical protein
MKATAEIMSDSIQDSSASFAFPIKHEKIDRLFQWDIDVRSRYKQDMRSLHGGID